MLTLYHNKTLGGILLIAGTAIGAGMLALPIITGAAGFYSSVALMIVCFVFTLFSLFALLEVSLWSVDPNANIISMAGRHLGFLGQLVAWVSCLLLMCSATAAYLSEGGSLIGQLIQPLFPNTLPAEEGICIFTIVFGVIIFLGTQCVDYVNRVLMIGLIFSYLALLFFVAPHVNLSHLREGHPKYLLATVPVVVVSFTSQMIVPSLKIYLGGDVKALKKAFIIGSILPLLFYVVWELLTIGLIPVKGSGGLISIAHGPHPVAALTNILAFNLRLVWIAFIVGGFSFFALATSFLGVTLSLLDFLCDGLGMKKTAYSNLLLIIITLFPPFLFAVYYPSGFVLALDYAGVFVAVLYGVLPALMVWKGRYREKITADYRMPGNKVVLVLLLLGALSVIFLQIAAILNWLPIA